MIRKYLQDYFTFTKGERNAVTGLSVSLLVLITIPYFLPEEKIEIDEREFAAAAIDKTAAPHGKSEMPVSATDMKIIPEKFPFDPNTLEVAGWVKLGVKEKTAITIHRYLEKGGRFRAREDLLKIYGLPQEVAMGLMDYVKIRSVGSGYGIGDAGYPDRRSNDMQRTSKAAQYSNAFRSDVSGNRFSHGNKPGFGHGQQNSYSKGQFNESSTGSGSGSSPWKSIRKNMIVDIATADTSELIALPGIGSKLANRIVSFRQKLGGFYAVEQLKDLFGLSDSVYQILRPMLKVSSGNISKINVNLASEEVLRAHPYLRWQLAKAIVSFRKEHGEFGTVEDIQRIDLLDSKSFEKLRPYIEL